MKRPARYVLHQSKKMDNKIQCYIYYMFMRQTDPWPVYPSKQKKLAIGGSRAASAFSMS